MKNLVFKIKGKAVELVDWDITIEEIELLKSNIAFVNSVELDEVEIDVIDVIKQELSETTFVGKDGLQYKAPNPYSMLRPINGLILSGEIDTNRTQNGIEKISEAGLNHLLDKIISGRVDDVIIYS